MRLPAVFAVCLTALLLAACGATPRVAGPSSPQPTQSLTLLPSADPYHSAIVATRAMGTARAAIDASYATIDGTRRVRADGAVVLPTGSANLQWTTPDGTYRELINDRGIFVTRDGTSWTQWAVDDPTPTSGFADVLRGLDTLRDVSAGESSSVDGVPATHYRGWLPVSAGSGPGLPTDLSLTADKEAREAVDVWIDGPGHVIKVQRQVVDAQGRDAYTSTTSLADFALLLDITTPTHNVTMGTRPAP